MPCPLDVELFVEPVPRVECDRERKRFRGELNVAEDLRRGLGVFASIVSTSGLSGLGDCFWLAILAADIPAVLNCGAPSRTAGPRGLIVTSLAGEMSATMAFGLLRLRLRA